MVLYEAKVTHICRRDSGVLRYILLNDSYE